MQLQIPRPKSPPHDPSTEIRLSPEAKAAYLFGMACLVGISVVTGKAVADVVRQIFYGQSALAGLVYLKDQGLRGRHLTDRDKKGP